MRGTRLAIGMAALALCGVTVAAQVRTVSTVRDVMIDMVMPSSDALFGAAAGFEAPSEEIWTDLARQARILAEAGNLLMVGDRAHAGDDQWAGFARAQVDVGADLLEAVTARDFDRLVELNDPLYETCVNCHGQYLTN